MGLGTVRLQRGHVGRAKLERDQTKSNKIKRNQDFTLASPRVCPCLKLMYLSLQLFNSNESTDTAAKRRCAVAVCQCGTKTGKLEHFRSAIDFKQSFVRKPSKMTTCRMSWAETMTGCCCADECIAVENGVDLHVAEMRPAKSLIPSLHLHPIFMQDHCMLQIHSSLPLRSGANRKSLLLGFFF